MLEFGKDVLLRKTTESPHMADLLNVTTIYVYSDIVQSHIVGDTNARFLRTISTEGKHGDTVSKTFTNIQYVPVQTTFF